MESEVLKAICASQGSVDTDFLIYNLGSGDSTNDIVSNKEKFALCCPFGQPKVVARTKLKLCRVKGCLGACAGLHLCKNVLFSGYCQYSANSHRLGCIFSHELDSARNVDILRSHGLETLNRTELCTLLLQSDFTLVPAVCHDYNNDRCQEGDKCERLHICERYLNSDCSCFRCHDFRAPQPLTLLKKRGIPDSLVPSMKSVCANKSALRFHDRVNSAAAAAAAAANTDGRGIGRGRGGIQGNRGNRGYRGNRGNSGNRGNQGNPQPQQQTSFSETSDPFDAFDDLDLYTDFKPYKVDSDQQRPSSPPSSSKTDFSAAVNNAGHPSPAFVLASSDSGLNRDQALSQSSTLDIGRGGNRGSHQQLPQSRSINNVFAAISVAANRGNSGNRGNQGNPQPQRQTSSSGTSNPFDAFDDLDLYTDFKPYELDSDQQRPSSPPSSSKTDFSAARNNAGHLSPAFVLASSDSCLNRDQALSQSSKLDIGRGGNRGSHQQLLQSSSVNNVFAAVGVAANSDDGSIKMERQRPAADKTEICMNFIHGCCEQEERCFKAHDRMPYRWQVNDEDKWTSLPDNETIEKDYCDPAKTYSGTCPQVHFDTMTRGSNKVRRLSTINSLIQPDFIHTTEWLWYWEDEFGKWNIYASATAAHKQADMSSAQLEQKYLENDKDVVEFTADSQSYSLSFLDMIQTNKHYGTKRLVKRRPRFVSAADVRTAKVRKPLGQPGLSAIPDHWDKTQIVQTGYKRVALQRSSTEYKEIESLFCETVRGFDIVTIERIQNKALWEVYQCQKNQMSNSAARDVTERNLFHGTDSKHVDSICQNNFGWRTFGTHGTAFGNGFYFAQDAKYCHSCTGDSVVRSMFVSRVLVGDYTRGSSQYVRPPCRDGGDVNFYDSCVDDVLDPSIFVVFEKDQIYPEYLLQYTNQNDQQCSENRFRL